MTEQEMIDKFLSNGGEIQQCENIFDEYSKFGGKTRSHLDRIDIIGGERLMPKHQYEGKTFLINGIQTTCISHLVKRSKKGSLYSYFRFTNGEIHSEGKITRMINIGKAIILGVV